MEETNNNVQNDRLDHNPLKSNGKNLILIVIIALLVTFIIVRVHGTGEIVKTDMGAPDFELERVGGGVVKLSDYKGKVILLNFWATWCPPCVDEMPVLERLHRKLEGKNFVLIAVSVDNNIRTVERFIKDFNLSFTVLHDKNGDVSEMYGTFQYPETYIIGRDGKVVQKQIGAIEWDNDQFVKYLESLQ